MTFFFSLHEHYRKKRKWFRSLFLSFWIRVELIARVQIVKYFTGDELNPNSKGQKKWAKSLSFFPIIFMKHFYFTLGWTPKLVGSGLRSTAPIVHILNSNRFVFVQIVKYFTGDELNPNSKGQKKWAKSLSFFPIMFMKNFYFTLGWNPKLVGYGLRRPAPIDNILNSNRFVFEIFHNLDKNKTVWIQNVNNWCSTTETITYKFWVSPQCEIKMLYENYRRKRKSFSITCSHFEFKPFCFCPNCEIFHGRWAQR